MTFPNPRLHSQPAERLRARCLLAERFVSNECIEDNGGTISGSVSVNRGATIQDGGSVVIPTQSARTNLKATLFMRFSAVDEGAVSNFFSVGGTLLNIVFTDGTVTASHTDGVTSSPNLTVEYDYMDGENHVVMYAVDTDNGTHELFIGSESESGATTVTGSIIDSDVTFYGIQEHTVYRGLLFNDVLDADDFSILSDEQWTDFMWLNLFAVFRCNTSKDDTNGNYIRDTHGDKKFTKGDGSTSSTFPVFGGDNDDEFYEFEATSYLSDTPELPDDYTLSVCSSDTQYAGRFLSVAQADNDDSLLDEMTTPGGFSNDNLHNIVISNRELLAIEKLHVEHQQKKDYWRSTCRGIIHHLISEGVCRVSMLFNCPETTRNLVYDVETSGTKTGTYTDGENFFINFVHTYGRVDLPHESGDENVREITIIAYFANLEPSASIRTIMSKGGNFNWSLETAADRMTFNTSAIIDSKISEAQNMLAMSAVYGEKARFFVDDLYIGESATNVTLTNTDNTNDWVFGNNVTTNLPFNDVDAKAFLAFDTALTDEEIIAVYHALKNSFEYDAPPSAISAVWQDTTTSTEVKNDTTTSTDIVNDRVI